MSSLYWKTTELEVCIVDLIFFVRLTSKLHGVFYAFLSQNWRVPEPLTVRSSLLHMPTEPTEPLLSCYLLIAWVRECPSCTSLQWDAGGVVSLNLLWKSCSSEEMCRETSFLALHHCSSEEMCRETSFLALHHCSSEEMCRETSFLALHPWAWWCLPEAQYCNSYPITPREPSRRDELHRAESRAGRWGGPVLARLELPCPGLSSMLVINLPYCLSQCSQDFLRVFDFPWCMFF